MKRQYNKPTTQIVELKYSNILCTSDKGNRDVWSEVPGLNSPVFPSELA